MKDILRSPWVWAVCGLALAGITPLFVTNNYSLSVLAFIGIHTILAIGLNLLMGYAGQVSLGHAAFYGLGAYSSAVLTTQYGWSPWLAIIAGLVLTCSIALLIGMPCLRLHGHYLAMATLGFGWIINIVMKQWETVTQGPSGIERIPSLTIGNMVFDTDASRFYLIWVFAILILLISANLINSRVGRALRALHGSEAAASTLGVNVAKYKVQVFVLSAAYASLAGSLYAHTVNFISPSAFGFIFSVELVVMVVIGGLATVWGALIGAGAITLLVEWLRSLGHQFPVFQESEMIAHGLILILVMIFMPTGLVAGVRDGIGKLMRNQQKTVVQPAEVKERTTP